MEKFTLVIGDYIKSSWSMRAWLILKTAEVPFDTVCVRLEQSDTRANILRYSPSGKVPVLILKNYVINDSLAIAETIAERFPQAKLWPGDEMLRARARSATAEMHSGFISLRTQMPFGITSGDRIGQILPETQWEIDRLLHIWWELLTASKSRRFLCGDFGIVDAMFAPVMFRFRRYGIDVPADLKFYMDSILNYSPIQEWVALAEEELQASETVSG